MPPAWAHIQHRHPGGFFVMRVAGVPRRADDVLLHRAEDDVFWSLPGGRVGFGETAEDAIRREMLEETRAEVLVGPLVAIVENFFAHGQLDRVLEATGEVDYHEMGLYFHIDVPPDLMDQDGFDGVELEGTEHEFRLLFRWVSRDDLQFVDIRPSGVRDLLAAPFDPVVRHIVDHE